MNNKINEILKNTFGFDKFLPHQEDIITSILNKQDVLAIMPTGSGKSLTYQIPALIFDGLTLVVSPMISLMKDQSDSLNELGIKARGLNSSYSSSENYQTINLIKNGNLKILFVAPERLLQPETLNIFKNTKVSLIAIDEVHCVASWGHDFRKEYLRLGEVRPELKLDVPILSLTATADNRTKKEIIDKIYLGKSSKTIEGGYDRPNIFLSFAPKNNAKNQILSFIQQQQNSSGIIYCSSRKKTEDLANFLKSKGFNNVLPYHAKLTPKQKADAHELFKNNDDAIITATIAFGMGIDKPNVRFVCHLDMPSNIESYYQEIGRAGRDGLPANAFTIYGMDDIMLRSEQIQSKQSSEDQKRLEFQRLGALISLCDATRCRRQVLLNYFNEKIEKCDNCDICVDGIDLIDGTEDAQKILSAITRTGERFGSNHIINILIGKQTDNIIKFGHDKLKTFGVGNTHNATQWRSIIRQLYSAGHINIEMENYGALKITATGTEILYGRRNFSKRSKDIIAPKNIKVKLQKMPLNEDTESNMIFDLLKNYRTEKAKEKKIAPYRIFSDRTAIELANKKPILIQELYDIHGLAEIKIGEYGEDIIEIITEKG
ncbi:MAG: DNA helicase RecQ [SAR202 cluster bacterium]|nr:DNA helicase RecQ [SAR202 cluster bacterium]|tara:strand:+ start:1609 stop:3417 length:1809 start_codon:yes stop_codon:yes gene_type:complete